MLHTLSKAIGLESFSIGADDKDDEEEVDAALEGWEVVEATDVVDENCGRSV